MDYLLKSSICMTVFYGLYFFGFRRMSFHAINRFYLLASLALSLTIPMLSYEREKIIIIEPSPASEITYSEEIPMQSPDNQELASTPQVLEPQVIKVDWMQILTKTYLLGVIIMLTIFFRNLILIIRTLVSSLPFTSLSERIRSERIRVLITERSRSNASFFNYIFINPENLNPHEQALIIAHESFHAQRLHTVDLLILGILKSVFWFNPIIYFYQKSLKQIHEYEVDALMLATHDSREYAYLLLKLSVAPNTLITNQFSTKPLTDRIQFLFKKPTQNMKKLLYFLSLPLIAGGIMAFAEENVRTVYQEKVGKNNVIKPLIKTETKNLSARKTVNDTLSENKIPKIDSSKFSYTYNFFDFKFSLSDTDSFKLSIDNKLLIQGKDYIVKNNKILLDNKYKGKKSKLQLYGKPTGFIFYPELTKLNKVDFPDMRFSSKIPVFLAKTDNKLLPQTSKSASYFSKITRNQDTLRTILETHKLGKNPLVFVNEEEYPSSILYRINPDEVTNTTFYPPNSRSGVERFGEAAKDGVIKISTKEDDFILKNDKQHKIAVENVRKRLIESKKRVRRVIFQDLNGVKYEEISFQSNITGGTYGYSLKLPRGQKILFFLDGKLVGEDEINSNAQPFTVSTNKEEISKEKYNEELKKADVIFNLKTKKD